MAENIKMAAVDIDGTFVRSDYTYDVPRFKRILSHMKKEGCKCPAVIKRPAFRDLQSAGGSRRNSVQLSGTAAMMLRC